MAVGAGRIFAINLLANSKPAEDAFARVGKAAGRIPTPMKIVAAAITAAFAAVTAVAVKSFKALLELGEEFNEVTRIIRVGTGAVGGDLAALEQSFRDVARAVPNAFADVASVVAELDTRTDLAGKGLEEMATQLLTLSRLMGGDARQTTREVTRLFNRFGLEAEESADMLDLLFRAAQASGAQVDRLAADVTKNAGALIGMGLSLEESVALFALFEREGVRAETVVRSLRSGFQRLTADGKPLQEALTEVFTELQTLDREAAVAKGFEIFGTQALELVDAVRDGRLSIADFTKQLVDGSDTIVGVAEETDGWREALDKLRNNLKLQFEPLAREVFRGVTEFVEELIPAAERVQEAYSERGLAGALEQVGIEWNRIYEEQIKPIWTRFLAFLEETVKPLALAIGEEIGAAIARGIQTAATNALRGLGKRLADAVKREAGGEQFGFFDSQVPQPSRTPFERTGIPKASALPPLPPPRQSPSSSPAGSGATGGTFADPFFAPDFPMFRPMATGGVVTSPTLALIGEAGPEAVIPLDRGGLGGQTVVNVTVTSADPQAVVEAIRRYTRANGPLSGVVNV
jgi:phage-related minor tail protein